MSQAWGTLDLAPIGSCTVSALVDRRGRFVWACLPRVDGEPFFSALLGGRDPADPQVVGHWSADLDGETGAEQSYVRNTAVLRTVLSDRNGGQVEILDFAPRLRRSGRTYRPTAFVRVIRQLAGRTRLRVRGRPTVRLDGQKPERKVGSQPRR